MAKVTNDKGLTSKEKALLECCTIADTIDIIKIMEGEGYSVAKVLIADFQPTEDNPSGFKFVKIDHQKHIEIEIEQLNAVRDTENLQDYVPKYVYHIKPTGEALNVENMATDPIEAIVMEPAGEHINDVRSLKHIITNALQGHPIHRNFEYVTQLTQFTQILTEWNVSYNDGSLRTAKSPHGWLLASMNTGSRVHTREKELNRPGLLPNAEFMSWLLVDGVSVPNPIGYALNVEWWRNPDNLTGLLGRAHGDLHSGNILYNYKILEEMPYLIDFNRHEKEAPRFYDIAQLELDLLIQFMQTYSQHDWQIVLEGLTADILLSQDDNHDLYASMSRRLSPLRNYIESTIENTKMGGDMKHHFRVVWWLTAAGVGLEFCRRKTYLDDKPRLSAISLLYAAYNLRTALDLLNIPYKDEVPEKFRINTPPPFTPTTTRKVIVAEMPKTTKSKTPLVTEEEKPKKRTLVYLAVFIVAILLFFGGYTVVAGGALTGTAVAVNPTTETPTKTPSRTPSHTPTHTPTPETPTTEAPESLQVQGAVAVVNTPTATDTQTHTATYTPTATDTATHTLTPSHTPTQTPVPASATPHISACDIGGDTLAMQATLEPVRLRKRNLQGKNYDNLFSELPNDAEDSKIAIEDIDIDANHVWLTLSDAEVIQPGIYNFNGQALDNCQRFGKSVDAMAVNNDDVWLASGTDLYFMAGGQQVEAWDSVSDVIEGQTVSEITEIFIMDNSIWLWTDIGIIYRAFDDDEWKDFSHGTVDTVYGINNAGNAPDYLYYSQDDLVFRHTIDAGIKFFKFRLSEVSVQPVFAQERFVISHIAVYQQTIYAVVEDIGIFSAPDVDGAEFELFQSALNIIALTVDKQGIPWISIADNKGTEEDISDDVYEVRKYQPTSKNWSVELRDFRVNDIAFGCANCESVFAEDYIWFGTENNGVLYRDLTPSPVLITASATASPENTIASRNNVTRTPSSSATATATRRGNVTATAQPLTATPAEPSAIPPTLIVPILTPVPEPTNTPVRAPTSTPVPAPTSTPVPASTSTPVPASTNTPVPVPTTEPTDARVLPSYTPTSAPSDTPVPTATNTQPPGLTHQPPSNTPKPPNPNKPPTHTPKPSDTPAPTEEATLKNNEIRRTQTAEAATAAAN